MKNDCSILAAVWSASQLFKSNLSLVNKMAENTEKSGSNHDSVTEDRPNLSTSPERNLKEVSKVFSAFCIMLQTGHGQIYGWRMAAQLQQHAYFLLSSLTPLILRPEQIRLHRYVLHPFLLPAGESCHFTEGQSMCWVGMEDISDYMVLKEESLEQEQKLTSTTVLSWQLQFNKLWQDCGETDSSHKSLKKIGELYSALSTARYWAGKKVIHKEFSTFVKLLPFHYVNIILLTINSEN